VLCTCEQALVYNLKICGDLIKIFTALLGIRAPYGIIAQQNVLQNIGSHF
jgi:hypothetical protein